MGERECVIERTKQAAMVSECSTWGDRWGDRQCGLRALMQLGKRAQRRQGQHPNRGVDAVKR